MIQMRLLAVTAMIMSVQAFAQTADSFPSKNVRLIIPFAAGGSTDLLARSVAQQLNELWKRPVIAENRPGAGAIIGTEYASKAPADGHTIVIGTVTSHAVAATLHPKLPYDIQRDFAPITELATIPQLLSVHPSLPPKSVKELIALARQRPGELNFGGSIGSAQHMAMSLLQWQAKIKMTHVPYKGSGPTMIDVLGGHLQVTFDVIMTTLPHMQSGKLRTLAISSLTRSVTVPRVPTVAESGYPGYEAMVWFGLFAPANTPAAIVRKLSEDTARVLKAPKMRETLASQGLDVIASTPGEFAARVTAEIAKWRNVIVTAGIKLE